MCYLCGTDNTENLYREARLAAEDILDDYFRIPVRKGYDLNDVFGYYGALSDLTTALKTKAKSLEDKSVLAVIRHLDIDWKSATAAERRDFIFDALHEAKLIMDRVPGKIQTVLNSYSTEVVKSTRENVREHQHLPISADFNQLDRRIIKHLRKSEANYVTDEYGRRRNAFSMKAREIVSQGLESGLGRDDISEQLHNAATKTLAGRGSAYWNVVAGSFITRGRTFAQISAYTEAGIQRYIWESVLDEATTEVCRYLHGKTFNVENSLNLFEQVEANPDKIKEMMPWARNGVDDQGRLNMYVPRPNGKKARIAIVDKPAVGTRDLKGQYSRGLPPGRLQNLGVCLPPAHALCRSTTVADVTGRFVTPRVRQAVPAPKKTTDGPAALLAQSKTFASSSGQSLPLDSGFVENFDVQFRLENVDGRDFTKVRFKVTDNYAESVKAAILKGEKINRDDLYFHVPGTPDGKTGKIKKGRQRGDLKFDAISASFGKARVHMVTQKGALYNFIEMDIPTANATEAFKAYGEAAKKMGISEAFSFPSADSLDVLRKAKLITQYDRVGWENLRKLKEISPDTIGPIFEESLKRFPELKEVFKDTKLIQTAKGHVALYSPSQAKRLKKDGVVGLFHDLSNPDIIKAILGDKQGSGLLSSTQRYNRGVFVNGMSTATDFNTGGADGVFTRVVVRGKENDWKSSYGARILIDSDQLGRSDWYFFNEDAFGAAGPNQFKSRVLAPEIKKRIPYVRSSNEMIFQHGIPVEALRGVVIHDIMQRRSILADLKAKGITKVNGKPIDAFFLEKETY